MSIHVAPMPADSAERWRWLVELDEALVSDVYSTADKLLEETDSVDAIHGMTLGLGAYIAARVTVAVEMAADTWAASK